MSRYIHGLHDPGGEHLMADKPGWIVFTEEIGANPADQSGRDYRQWSDRGFGVVVRVNHGYGSMGTIPTIEKYGNFAKRFANFVAASQGCDTWLVGNEPNHSAERPNGVPISSAMYIDCFKRVHEAVRQQAGTRHGLIPAPVAPWNVETGDWLAYQATIWEGLWQLSAGVAIHAYTHGASPALVTSMERMGAPYQDRFYHFQAYRDFMIRVPQRMRGLPAYITETDQNDPWVDANTGWVQAVYAEIDRWNKTDGAQKIYFAALYRWPKYDRWSIVDKPGVHTDFRAAVAAGYTSPVGSQEQVTEQTHIPAVSTGTSPVEPALPPRQIDPRATGRGVRILEANVEPGETYWRAVKVDWLDEQQAQGSHHIYVDALDEQGKRVTDVSLGITWPGGGHYIATEAKPGEPYSANFPMSPSRNEFAVRVIEPSGTSDEVYGIGMGADTPGGYNAGIHTSTAVIFQRVGVATQPVPTPTPTTHFVAAPAGANLRTAPDLETGVIVETIVYGEPVTVNGYDVGSDGKQWARVWHTEDGKTWAGWVRGDLLGDAPPTPPIPVPTPQPTPPTSTPTSGIIDPRVLQAILAIESGGRTHGTDGRIIIRFEAHVFKTYLKNDALWAEHFRTNTERPWVDQMWRRSANDAWQLIHTGKQADEWLAFDAARMMSTEAAYESISMGAGQLMGFHYARLGYPSANAMFSAFRSAPVQTIGFINFFLSDPGLMDAVRRKDWREIAKRYNGSSNVDAYAPLLEKAYREASQ